MWYLLCTTLFVVGCARTYASWFVLVGRSVHQVFGETRRVFVFFVLRIENTFLFGLSRAQSARNNPAASAAYIKRRFPRGDSTGHTPDARPGCTGLS